MAENFNAQPGRVVAACQAAAAGGFVANTNPYGVTSVGAPAASVYLVTLAVQVDALQCVPLVCCALLDRGAIAAQATDTTFNVTTYTGNTGVAVDAIFNFVVIRTKVG